MAIAKVLRRPLGGSALAALTTFAVQSRQADPNHPAPLGPGVNRSNVDNSGKGHTFYFYAGPGHIDVDMAFEEMGLFGAPLRQTMNFDPLRTTTTLPPRTTPWSRKAHLARNPG